MDWQKEGIAEEQVTQGCPDCRFCFYPYRPGETGQCNYPGKLLINAVTGKCSRHRQATVSERQKRQGTA